ncbi:MAG: DUF4178 domain-containing protein [Lautropia sp.]
MRRSFVTLCPSCGAEVRFESGDSVLAVCGHCASTLLRRGDAVANLGRMAELFDDHSPLALGAQGRDGGRGFGVIGRLQYRYPAGVWNEWRLLYDDGAAGWLSEDNGNYVLTDDGAVDGIDAPAFDELRIDQVVPAGGVPFRVVTKDRAEVIAGAGELPFQVGAGYPAPVADLRGPEGEFATLDYSDDAAPPRFHRGRAVQLADLAMSGLRTEFTRQVAAEAFSCPSCGAPVQPKLATTRSISCASCASVIDLTHGTGRQMAAYRQAELRPLLLPLQSTGRFDGIAWTVVGYQQRRGVVDGEGFTWDEYLLYAPGQGFRFLIHDAGHWTWMRTLQRAIRRSNGPHGRGLVQFDGKRFDLYGRYPATVEYVAGEFYWRVQRDDRTENSDYIAPPETLSCEQTAGEITWSHGRYLGAAEVTAAFRLARPLPAPRGLGMIQPAPAGWRRAHLVLAGLILGGLLLLQIYLMIAGSGSTLVPTVPLAFGGGRDHLIEIGGRRPANLIVRTDANLTNQAIMVNVEVAPRVPVAGSVAAAGAFAAAAPVDASREVSFWEGRDSDGYWSEGSRTERIVFKLPPGPYLVRVAGEYDTALTGTPAARLPTAVYRIEQSSRPTWLPFLAGLLVLAILNAIGVFGAADPETRRWADSQFGTRPGRPAAD